MEILLVEKEKLYAREGGGGGVGDESASGKTGR